MSRAGDIVQGRVVVCWNKLKSVVVTCTCQFMLETSCRADHAGWIRLEGGRTLGRRANFTLS